MAGGEGVSAVDAGPHKTSPVAKPTAVAAAMPGGAAATGYQSGGGGLFASLTSLLSRVGLHGVAEAQEGEERAGPLAIPTTRPEWDSRMNLPPQLFDRQYQLETEPAGGGSSATQRKVHAWRGRWEAKHIEPGIDGPQSPQGAVSSVLQSTDTASSARHFFDAIYRQKSANLSPSAMRDAENKASGSPFARGQMAEMSLGTLSTIHALLDEGRDRGNR